MDAEAVAIGVCGRRKGSERHRLLLQELVLVPYSACSVRSPDRVTWPTDILVPILQKASRLGMAIIKIHGHRGYDRFSEVDDHADRLLFPSVRGWFNEDDPHASVIVLDSGRMFGRTIDSEGVFTDLDCINVVGDDLPFWYSTKEENPVPEFGRRISQSFGAGTYDCLKRLRIAVVGCSGTGSPVIEQLARNCVGKLVLVDPDIVEEKNLNRIINSSMMDAITGEAKVQVAKRSVERMGLGTTVHAIRDSLFSSSAVEAVGECDIVFGCMDSIDGRHLLNKLATFYLLPYFDLGVKLEADGRGGVDQVCGTVNYLQPGGSSLFSRGVYNLEQVRAAGLQRSDPTAYSGLLNEGYIQGIREDRPAVVQLNSLISSLAVNELLARLHPYRIDPNADYAIHRLSLSHGIYEHEPDGESCAALLRHTGRGDVEPLLDWPELSLMRDVA